MSHRDINVDRVLRRAGDRPMVGVLPREVDESRQRHLFDRFAERRWQPVHLYAYWDWLPEHIALAGALLDGLPDGEQATRLLAAGVPCVRVGRFPHPEDHRVPAVIPDRRATARLAADHFAERGFRHMGYVGREGGRWHGEVYGHVRDAAEARGLHCHLLSLSDRDLDPPNPDQVTRQQRRQLRVEAWCREVPKPLGLVTWGPADANRFCRWVIDAGLAVPEDIAILSLSDDLMMCEGAAVPISAIDTNPLGLIDAAVDTLEGLIDGRSPQATTIEVPPSGIVTRPSTDVLAASDPRVAQALRFMWDHVAEDLSVDRIAEHVGVSRWTLADAFRRELGRGVNAEFQRRRLEKARELLQSTQLSIQEVAEALSFSSHGRFSRVFREAFGLSPTAFRSRTERRPTR